MSAHFSVIRSVYRIFGGMASFFLTFLGGNVDNIVYWSQSFGETDPPFAKLREGIVFGRLRRGYGAPGEKLIHFAGGTRRVGKQMRLRRLTSEGGWVPRGERTPPSPVIEPSVLSTQLALKPLRVEQHAQPATL